MQPLVLAVLITLFLVSLAAAVVVGVYTFGVLFGKWSRPPTGTFVAPPPPPARTFVPFIAPVAPLAPAAVAPPAPHVEHATALSSVFVTLPMQHDAVPAPAVTARGTRGNPSLPPRTAKGSIPPPLPSRPTVTPRAARAPEPSDFLDEETYLDLPRR